MTRKPSTNFDFTTRLPALHPIFRDYYREMDQVWSHPSLIAQPDGDVRSQREDIEKFLCFVVDVCLSRLNPDSLLYSAVTLSECNSFCQESLEVLTVYQCLAYFTGEVVHVLDLKLLGKLPGGARYFPLTPEEAKEVLDTRKVGQYNGRYDKSTIKLIFRLAVPEPTENESDIPDTV